MFDRVKRLLKHAGLFLQDNFTLLPHNVYFNTTYIVRYYLLTADKSYSSSPTLITTFVLTLDKTHVTGSKIFGKISETTERSNHERDRETEKEKELFATSIEKSKRVKANDPGTKFRENLLADFSTIFTSAMNQQFFTEPVVQLEETRSSTD